MGKYSTSSRRPATAPRDSMPPLMRGIGCILFVLVPFVSYGIAALLVNYGQINGWPIPPKWYDSIHVPAALANLPGIGGVLTSIASQNNLIANLIFMLGISVILFGLMAVLYGYIYAMVGPSRYGPTDVPPIRVKTKKYKR